MKHILVLDDEQPIREMLCELLVSVGYRFTGAATLQQAMKTVSEDTPDLAITDLQLEESDGFVFIERLHELKPGTPVILLTGMLFDEATITARYAGSISGYVQKTSPLSHILAEIKKHLPDED